jgi:hypothetical protein
MRTPSGYAELPTSPSRIMLTGDRFDSENNDVRKLRKAPARLRRGPEGGTGSHVTSASVTARAHSTSNYGKQIVKPLNSILFISCTRLCANVILQSARDPCQPLDGRTSRERSCSSSATRNPVSLADEQPARGYAFNSEADTGRSCTTSAGDMTCGSCRSAVCDPGRRVRMHMDTGEHSANIWRSSAQRTREFPAYKPPRPPLHDSP